MFGRVCLAGRVRQRRNGGDHVIALEQACIEPEGLPDVDPILRCTVLMLVRR